MTYAAICTNYFIWEIFFQEYCVLAELYFELPFFRLFEFGADTSHGLVFYHTLLAEKG